MYKESKKNPPEAYMNHQRTASKLV